MSRRRWAAFVATVVLVSMVGVAQGTDGDWDGYCDGDTPVFTHEPLGDYKARCHEDSIKIGRAHV